MSAVEAASAGATLPWLSRALNPGNWILDAGMGIFTAITATVGELLQQSVMSMLGVGGDKAAIVSAFGPPAAGQWSVIPSSCSDGSLQNFVFCTPPSLTYAHPGVRNVWGVLRAVATGLVTILFTVRLGRMLSDGPRALAAEGKPLVLTFVVTLLFVQGTAYTCGWLIDFFNAISESILAGASFTFPAVSDTPFEIGARIMGACFWLLMLVLTLKGFFRVVAIAVLVGVAPLAGAMLMDQATASRFRAWLEKLIELLIEQVALIIVLTVAPAMLPIQGAGGGDQFVGFLLGSIGLLSALFGPSAMIGIASGVGGGYLQSMMQMRVIGGAQKVAAAGVRQAGRASVHAASAAGSLIQARGGDPAFSAAAQRMGASVAGAAGRDDVERRAHVAYRTPSAEARAGDAASPTSQRYVRAATAGSDAGRRRQAAIRAQGMMAMADGLDRAGERDAASRMRGRAGLQRAYASGEDISRTPRWSTGRRDAAGRLAVSSRGVERRAVYAQALSETRARHDAEHGQLRQAIAADQEILAGAATPETEHARRAAHQRVTANQARLAHLSQRTARSGARLDVAPVTRREAAALANERWTQRELARPTRPSISTRRSPEAAVAGAPPQLRRVSPATVPAHAGRAGATLHVRARRAASPASAAPAQAGTPIPTTPAAGAAGTPATGHVQRRADSAADHHQRRATAAFGEMCRLQREASAVALAAPDRAEELRRQADNARRQGQRHLRQHTRTTAIARDPSWQRPASRFTDEERARRRSVFLAVRAEVRAAAERDALLPETAPDRGEYLRRVAQMQQTTQQLARERLGALAAPSRRRDDA